MYIQRIRLWLRLPGTARDLAAFPDAPAWMCFDQLGERRDDFGVTYGLDLRRAVRQVRGRSKEEVGVNNLGLGARAADT